MADPSIQRIERQLLALIRRHDRVRSQIDVGDQLVLERAAYTVLGVLHEDGPVRASALSAQLGLDKTTVSRHVSQLEAQGLVARVPDPHDGRAQLLALTDDGKARYTRTRTRRHAVLGEQLADWSDEDRATFAGFLERYNAAMDQRFGAPADPAEQEERA